MIMSFGDGKRGPRGPNRMPRIPGVANKPHPTNYAGEIANEAPHKDYPEQVPGVEDKLLAATLRAARPRGPGVPPGYGSLA